MARIFKWYQVSEREWVLRDRTAFEERGDPDRVVGWAVQPTECKGWLAVINADANGVYRAFGSYETLEAAKATVLVMYGVTVDEVHSMIVAATVAKRDDRAVTALHMNGGMPTKDEE